MLTHKSLLTVVVAAACSTPMAVLADGWVSAPGVGYAWEGARYERVDGHWTRVDQATTKADGGELSGFVGTGKRSDAQGSSPDKSQQETSAGDTQPENDRPVD